MKRLCKPQIIESVANYIVTEIEKKKLIIAKKNVGERRKASP